MLSYPSAISLSSRTLDHVADLIRTHRARLRSRWRRLDPGSQALLVLAHLRNGDTYQQLAAGFGIGLSTAWRYIHETIDLLATAATDLRAAGARASPAGLRHSRRHPHPDRPGSRRPALLLWKAQTPRPQRADTGRPEREPGVGIPSATGIAARPDRRPHHHLIEALTDNQVMTFADKGYRGAGGSIRTPFKRHRHRPSLSVCQREVNRSHVRIRGIGERAVATLRTWRILTKLRCCPQRGTPIVQAILALESIETSTYSL
jgi:hypothetical protein